LIILGIESIIESQAKVHKMRIKEIFANVLNRKKLPKKELTSIELYAKAVKELHYVRSYEHLHYSRDGYCAAKRDHVACSNRLEEAYYIKDEEKRKMVVQNIREEIAVLKKIGFRT